MDKIVIGNNKILTFLPDVFQLHPDETTKYAVGIFKEKCAVFYVEN